jgi:hypothetical protein
MPILTRKTLVYAEVESTYGTPANFSDSTSAMLCENADYSLDIQKIQRNIYRNDLSPVADIIGRKMGMMKFTHELRGGGVAGTECRLGRLLRGCTMVATVKATPWWGSFLPVGSNASSAVSWASGGTISGVMEPKTIAITVTTGGASGTAKFSITYDDGSTQQTDVTATTATPISLTGTQLSSGTITPTFTGSLVIGQSWVVTVWPAGIMYLPSSTQADYASLTINMYKDGVLHQLTGAYGTFKVTAQAGQRATVDFQFTGFYVQPADQSFPAAPVFETTLPSQVELGRLHVDGFGINGPAGNACVVDQFSFDIANKIEPRTSINAANGWTGLIITERGSTGGVDPEATLVATQDFWTKLANAYQMPFGMRVGNTTGNMWAISAPAVQYTGLTYKDRNGISALDAALQFNRLNGDDEIALYAC